MYLHLVESFSIILFFSSGRNFAFGMQNGRTTRHDVRWLPELSIGRVQLNVAAVIRKIIDLFYSLNSVLMIARREILYMINQFPEHFVIMQIRFGTAERRIECTAVPKWLAHYPINVICIYFIINSTICNCLNPHQSARKSGQSERSMKNKKKKSHPGQPVHVSLRCAVAWPQTVSSMTCNDQVSHIVMS